MPVGFDRFLGQARAIGLQPHTDRQRGRALGQRLALVAVDGVDADRHRGRYGAQRGLHLVPGPVAGQHDRDVPLNGTEVGQRRVGRNRPVAGRQAVEIGLGEPDGFVEVGLELRVQGTGPGEGLAVERPVRRESGVVPGGRARATLGAVSREQSIEQILDQAHQVEPRHRPLRLAPVCGARTTGPQDPGAQGLCREPLGPRVKHPADLVKAQVPVASPQIEVGGAQQPGEDRSTQHGHRFNDRVGQRRRGPQVVLDEAVILAGLDHRVAVGLVEPAACKQVARTFPAVRPGGVAFDVGQAFEGARDAVVTQVSGDLFDEVGFPLEVHAPARHGDADRAVAALRRQAERVECAKRDILGRCVAQQARQLRGPERQLCRVLAAGVDVDLTRVTRATRDFDQQPRGQVLRGDHALAVDTALEAMTRVGG